MFEFTCNACASPAVSYPDALEEHAIVVCARCAAKVCSYGEFRRRLEQILHSTPCATLATGC